MKQRLAVFENGAQYQYLMVILIYLLTVILRSQNNLDLLMDLGVPLGFGNSQTHHSSSVLPIQILHGLKCAFLATLLGSEVLQPLGIALVQLEDLLAAFWNKDERWWGITNNVLGQQIGSNR